MSEPKIIRLPMTEVNNGLEVLDHNGIHSGIWNRMRRDSAFCEIITGFIRSEYINNPGAKHTVLLNRIPSRLEMIDKLRQKHWVTLSDIEVKSLADPSPPWDRPDKQTAWREPFALIYYAVSLGSGMKESEIVNELSSRGLVPASNDDCLAFLLNAEQCEIIPKNVEHLVILDPAQMKNGEYIQIYCDKLGIPVMSLGDCSYFSRNAFLAKRKPEQESPKHAA